MRVSKKQLKKLCIQTHHLIYGENEKTVKLFRGEHWQITKLDRKFRLSKKKPFSLGFLEALASFYHIYGKKAVDLSEND